MALSLASSTQPVRMCTSSDSFVFVPTDVPADLPTDAVWIASVDWNSLTQLQYSTCDEYRFSSPSAIELDSFIQPDDELVFEKMLLIIQLITEHLLITLCFSLLFCILCVSRGEKKVIDSSYSIFATLAAMSSISRRVFGECLD